MLEIPDVVEMGQMRAAEYERTHRDPVTGGWHCYGCGEDIEGQPVPGSADPWGPPLCGDCAGFSPGDVVSEISDEIEGVEKLRIRSGIVHGMRTDDQKRDAPTDQPKLAEVVELPRPSDPNLVLVATLEELLEDARTGRLQMVAVAGVLETGEITSHVVMGEPGLIRLAAATSWLNHRALKLLSSEDLDK